ncbi:MAG: methyltransferase, partial [Gammaproteobacteria bacterium]
MTRNITYLVLLVLGIGIGMVFSSGSGPQSGSQGAGQETKTFDRRFDYGLSVDPDAVGTKDQGNNIGEAKTFRSGKLEAEITVLPGVFNPNEAEWLVLPILRNNPDLCEGKTVMEIGTGSGIISLYCAKLGATKVVSTDINPAAIETLTLNAKNLGFADIIEPRLVSLDDMSAYAVIGDDERFDMVISNPPFALDLDAESNDSVTDTGELGFSIVRGLDQHLEPGGQAVLFYDSLFYHEVMVKFARYSGWEARKHSPNGFFPWAAESLFNTYLRRLL